MSVQHSTRLVRVGLSVVFFFAHVVAQAAFSPAYSLLDDRTQRKCSR
jgi:hypothetical protein